MPGSSLRAAPWPLPWAAGSGQLRRQVPPPHRGQPPRDVSDGEARSSRRSAARAQRLWHAGERERARRGGTCTHRRAALASCGSRATSPAGTGSAGEQRGGTAVITQGEQEYEQQRGAKARERTLTSGAPCIA